MSKKVSAFQVYSEDQTHQRHARSYRAAASSRSQPQPSKYSSPPPRSSRTTSMDWRDDVKMDSRVPARHSSSPEIRRDRNYSYDAYDRSREDPAALRDSRYGENARQNDSRDRHSVQTRYQTNDQYDRCSWEREERRDDYAGSRDRGGHVRKDDYLTTLDTHRQIPPKPVQSSANYTDSDDECLHETLRPKKHQAGSFRVEEDDRRWSTDDDYEDYKQVRKRALSGAAYHSPSPEPIKDWREGRQFNTQPDHRNMRTYSQSGEDSDREHSDAPPVKKKKVKSAKKNAKSKEKKNKAAVQKSTAAASKIQSLMDVKIPSSVKKQVEQSTTSNTSLPRLGEGRSDYKFGRNNDDATRSFPRSQDDDRTTSRYNDDSSRNRSRYDDDYYQDHRRDSSFGHRESESDRRGHHSHKDSYSSRRSPDYDHRTYQQNDDYERGRDRQRRNSFSRDGRNNTEVVGTKRKRQSSVERRDWSRSGGRAAPRDRSPDFGNYTDSDQDSERGGRRSWRDERRDRQPKKKDEDRERGQKGEKKSKSKQEQAVKGSQRSKKSAAAKKDNPVEEVTARMQVVPCKDGGMAVFLTHPQKICLRGRARLQVMAGEVSVMGYAMEAKGSRSYDLFSPSTCSLITISTSCAEKEKKPLRRAVQALGVEEKGVKEFLTGAVILWASRLDFPAADYICTHPPFTQLFRFNFDRVATPLAPTPSTPDPVKVGAAFLSQEQATTMCVKASEDFDEALKKWTAAVKSSKTGPVGLLCGGVNSGKSTFSRFMVNAALSCVSKVCYLDCDVGQTEFSPPGTVALTVLDSPVFGPPFCHQKSAESMCFYGMASPAEGPSLYVQCVEHVLQAYRDMEHPPPLVINTMGWNKELGLQLFVDVLRLVTPDLVVQFNLATEVLNFPPITPHFAAHQPGWLYNTEPVEEEGEEEGEEEEEESAKDKKKHELVTVQSLVPSRNDPTRVKLTPKNLRDLALLAHLMQGFPPSVTLTSAKPYSIHWSRFAVHICHSQLPHTLMVDALRASVVALCKADLSEVYRTSEDLPMFFKETPVCKCFGYGLVRAVDHKTQTLKVVTSLSPEHLSQVNTLMKGSITIPDQLLLKQGHMEDVPFIDALEPAMAVAPVRPRTRMPRRH
ncbi:uncharacterized protein LOC143284894 [Babylonia areolata]|uniref:uncharacterized protein LOC143284894 n=1 Tax=Babylonia areolata TaxID=304850 RepID=UPI003FD67AFB